MKHASVPADLRDLEFATLTMEGLWYPQARDARLESPCHSLEIREGGVRCLIQAAMSLGPGAQRPETLDDKFLPGIGAVQLRQHFEPGSPVVEEVIVDVRVGGIGAQGAE